ncbi:hypothetical protein [Streptomyces sp. NPDC051577]|uniref:hypothetical protein n=1 Tax=Streptomyces sp. NPDC051577 TaxID=3155166 RepID=UPI003430C5E5
MLKRLCSALLSLAMAMGLVTALSGTASATNYSVIEWNISRITDGGGGHATRYFRLMDEIHRRPYGEPTEGENVTQTTTEAGRLIQVRVLDTNNEHVASVYLWADNLYVAGFHSPQSPRASRRYSTASTATSSATSRTPWATGTRDWRTSGGPFPSSRTTCGTDTRLPSTSSVG